MKKYVAECIGTCVLVVLGCGTAMLVGCDAASGSGYLLTALAFGLSMLNFYIETGGFVLNRPTDLLAFRTTRTFPGDTPEDTLLRDCRLQAEEAYETAMKYCRPVLSLAEGSMDIKEFVTRIDMGF